MQVLALEIARAVTMYINSSLGAHATITSFDACVPIGTLVYHRGVARRTWSHAGLGVKKVPVVFLDDGLDQPPVPLSELTIPGVKAVSQRRSSGEQTGKGHGRVYQEYSLCRDQ